MDTARVIADYEEAPVKRPQREQILHDLYTAEGQGASRLAFLLTQDRDGAQDVVQEAFARIARRLFVLQSHDHARAYLYRTVINLCHGRGRKLERERRLERTLRPDPHTEPRDLGEQDEMWRALRLVPPRQRAALFLRYYLDKSEVDTAEVLGCSISAVKSLVNRGLKTLRIHLSEVDDD